MSAALRQPEWSSSTRFVLVAVAAVVSLGNLWRLPFLIATDGGGAFLLVYAIALLAMGWPLFSAQLFMARGSGADVPGVIAGWTRNAPHARFWIWIGYLIVAGAGLLLAAYSVVAAWSLAYSLRAVAGGLAAASVDAASAQFVAFARDPERGFGWLLLVFCVLAATGSRGLRRGVEPVMRTLALLILILLALLLAPALWAPDALAAAGALVSPDFARLGWAGALAALSQAFFSLTLGSGVVVALGSTLPARAPVIRLSLVIVVVDLLVALAAAFVLAVHLHGRQPDFDAGLAHLFDVLPVVLAGSWQRPLMFVLVALVSLSTAIALFEPVVALVHKRSGFSRLRSTLYAATAVALVALLALLSFGALSGWRVLGLDAFDWLLLVATRAIAPVGALMLCVLVSRVLARRRLADAWHRGASPARARGFALWHALLRYPTRIALLLVVFEAWGGPRLIAMIWGQT